MDLFEFDYSFKKDILCGVDEAGRGPLAGPVVAAAVILKKDAKNVIFDVYDSKKLTEKKREQLFEKILEVAFSWNFAVVDSKTIDEINILNATMLAMKKAVEGLKIKPELVLVDGNKIPNLNCCCEFVVKGDSKSASIAAASIVAKVKRDQIMKELDKKYSNYFFKDNKGYGTKKHYESILKYGITSQHRKTFLKKLREKKFKIQNVSGVLGEKICYYFLLKNGFKVICKNFKSPFGEIDLIAIKNENIYFVEVKLRQKNCGYSPCEAVDLKKQKKIVKTAIYFNQKHKNSLQPKFVVMEVLRDKTGSFNVKLIDDAFFIANEHDLFKDIF